MLRFPAFENQTLKRPEWALASDLALATWLKCATQSALAENGGRFPGASSWDDRAWSIMAGVSAAGVEAAVAAGICRWEDDVLLVVGYEVKAEAIVQQRRAHGRLSPGRPPKGAGKNHAGSHTDNRTGNRAPNRARKALSSPSLSLPSLARPRSDSSESGSAGSKPPVFVFPPEAVVGTGTSAWEVGAKLHATLVAAYPAIDVAAEYPRVLAWLTTNQPRRKTRAGMPKFLNGWLSRAQNDRPRTADSASPEPSGPPPLRKLKDDLPPVGRASESRSQALALMAAGGKAQ
jgi:hypothetical protein